MKPSKLLPKNWVKSTGHRPHGSSTKWSGIPNNQARSYKKWLVLSYKWTPMLLTNNNQHITTNINLKTKISTQGTQKRTKNTNNKSTSRAFWNLKKRSLNLNLHLLVLIHFSHITGTMSYQIQTVLPQGTTQEQVVQNDKNLSQNRLKLLR